MSRIAHLCFSILFIFSLIGCYFSNYSDNFNDNFTGDEWCLIEWSGEHATLKENHHRLEFTADAGVENGADYQLCGIQIDTTRNFAYKVGWHLRKASGSGTFALCLGLAVSNSNDIVIGAGYDEGFTYFNCYSETANIDYTKPRTTTNGTVYISYNANRDILYLSINGYWRPENRLAGDYVVRGLLQGAWANKKVFAFLEGDTESSDAIVPGDAWFDNFILWQGQNP